MKSALTTRRFLKAGRINCTERGKHLIICSVLRRCVCPPVIFKRARCSNNRIKCLYFCQDLLSSYWRRLYLPNDICSVYCAPPPPPKKLPTQHCSSCNAGAQCEVSRLQRRLYSLISYRLGRESSNTNTMMDFWREFSKTQTWTFSRCSSQAVLLFGSAVTVDLSSHPVCQQRWERRLNVGVCSSRDLCLKQFVLSSIFTPPHFFLHHVLEFQGTTCRATFCQMASVRPLLGGRRHPENVECCSRQIRWASGLIVFLPDLVWTDKAQQSWQEAARHQSLNTTISVRVVSSLEAESPNSTSFTLLRISQAKIRFFFFSFTFCHFHRPFSDAML